MASSTPTSTAKPTLQVTYTHPTSAGFSVSLPVATPLPPPSSSSSSPAEPTTSLEAKTKYLAALRQAASTAQDRINAELTARMGEDKAREAAAAAVEEEANYGEEVVEED